MVKFLENEAQKLDTFKKYLIGTERISESTANDYCKRLLGICREEKINVDTLTNQIEKICYDYVEGEKKELGQRSHNSYRSALLKYKTFVISSNAQTKKYINSNLPSYHIEIQNSFSEHYGTIKLYDSSNNLIDIDFYKDPNLKKDNNLKDDLLFKCLLMLIKADPSKQGIKVIEILLNEFNVSITLDGKKAM